MATEPAPIRTRSRRTCAGVTNSQWARTAMDPREALPIWSRSYNQYPSIAHRLTMVTMIVPPGRRTLNISRQAVSLSTVGS